MRASSFGGTVTVPVLLQSRFFFGRLLPHCICFLDKAQEVGGAQGRCGWGEL